ncbi:MAG: Gfo/Idh/MocA family oxidoreductase [Anaerolineae bacterium]|nr:Gfo/Idh/MocA family oxidoreductase [Anaerolineae bacterium]
MLFGDDDSKALQVAFVGGGDYAYANILPSLQYVKMDLVAMADPERERGLAAARQFGARRFYPSHQALLAKEEELDAVLVVAGTDAQGYPRHPELAAAALEAKRHVWVGTPPCSSADDMRTLTNACMKSEGKYVMAGIKKMFAPAYVKVAEILGSPAFGKPASFCMRYPLVLPPPEERTLDGRLTPRFLEFVQVYGLLLRLFGECQGVSYLRSTLTGDAVINLAYRGGLVGTLHLTGGQALTSPLERLEVIGQGANLVVENGVRLIYYRPGGRRGLGEGPSESSFIGPDEGAPIIWEPEFSLGKLYNKGLFLQGYVGCLSYFAQQTLAGESPKLGSLVDILHIMTAHDKILRGSERQWIDI